MRARALLPLLLAATAASCGGARDAERRPVTRTPPPAPVAEPAPSPDAEIERRADEIMARAAANEPSVSTTLQKLAADLGGELAGFEHRLKKRDSLLRKMKKVMHEHPELKPDEVAIDDALRYTVQVDDKPPGRHLETIRTAFARLEAAGHHVHKIKNYWPPGDNYSGVNSVLEAPDGLLWELQFHTAESFRVQHRDHDLYEEYREVDTPLARKRELYKQLTAPWAKVPIPRGMLDPKGLQQEQEIIKRPPP